MERRTDGVDSKIFFQMDRFVQQNGEWFYMAREGNEHGPFINRNDAQGDLVYYLHRMHQMAAFGQ